MIHGGKDKSTKACSSTLLILNLPNTEKFVLIQQREKGGKSNKTSSDVDVDLLLSQIQQTIMKIV